MLGNSLTDWAKIFWVDPVVGRKICYIYENLLIRIQVQIFQNPVFSHYWEILVTTALSAAPDPLLLTIVQSLGVVRADFFASGHLVPGTTSSRVKKIFQG